MDSTIPAPDRFRQYAQTIGLFLEEMHFKYPSSLAFESEQDRQNALKWLELTQPVYQKDLARVESQLERDFKDVTDYWKSDHAYNTARRRVGDNESPASWLPWLIGQITDLALKYERDLLLFKTVRRFAEAELRWKQGLSLAVANYLDGTSYRVATEAKASATRIAELLSELENELQNPAARHLLDLTQWPGMGHRTRDDLRRVKCYMQSEELQQSFSFRNDKHLLGRITAGDILAANNWAFKRPRTDLAFILLGLSAFESPIDLEPKTLERVWARHKQQQWAIGGANHEAHIQPRDKKSTRKSLFSVRSIPNSIRPTSGD